MTVTTTAVSDERRTFQQVRPTCRASNDTDPVQGATLRQKHQTARERLPDSHTPGRLVTIPSEELRQGVRLAVLSATNPGERAQTIQLLLREMTDAATLAAATQGELSSLTNITKTAADHVHRMRGKAVRSTGSAAPAPQGTSDRGASLQPATDTDSTDRQPEDGWRLQQAKTATAMTTSRRACGTCEPFEAGRSEPRVYRVGASTASPGGPPVFAPQISPALPDSRTRAHIDVPLRHFSTDAFHHDLLHHIFVDIADMDLEEPLPLIGEFWEQVLFDTGAYTGNAMRAHRRFSRQEPFTPAHFERWLALSNQAVDDRHQEVTAAKAKQHAAHITLATYRNLNRSAARPSPAHGSSDPQPAGR